MAWARAAGYWWGALVDEGLIPGLIRDIEAAKGRQSVHEAECTLRYEFLGKTISNVQTDMTSVKTAVETLAKQGQHAAWSANWKAWVLAAAIGAGLLGGLSWTAGQLWALEPLRIQEAAHDAKK